MNRIIGKLMKISTKGRYALRLMADLTLHSEEGMVSVREIAKRQNISEKYLEQIIHILCNAGYVRSARGPKGGYMLNGKPSDYTVGMIIRLTEGDIAPAPCTSSHDGCPNEGGCAMHSVWTKIKDSVDGVFDGITLSDIVKEYQNERVV